ncbi:MULTISPECIES: hypothetical protein [unclassified Rhizobacter]|uniref:protein kinase domain-containing protein n=1 Tax=unclassified Rhizobacter TaxID=2640088 RepID=UPI0006F6FAE7|nr:MULTISPECIES: hypothetical protein [unclassified Rhizobacter]KQU73440.1 hypothetical protein ASC88_04295 [Rhizobacter sp. Root29]KQV98625.1 hypothetical protein ASC98_08125 [Rhizobacter sp. Root1238]KRB04878.1 hypothetical protein ASE08_13280 [Rhizobacter sp. Root16D2]
MTTPRAPQKPDFGPTTQFDTVPASDVLLAGARVGGFRIVELLGRGDSGVVYLALDSSLQRQVAIKEYFPTTLAQRGDGVEVVPRRSGHATAFEAGRREFLQRAKLFARFEHSALIRVQSFWEENGTAYYAMNFVPGPNLAGALKALPRAPDEAWLRAMLTPVLDAVDLLHAAQAHHGGISPEAIVVRGVGVPVLLASAPPPTDEKPLAPPGAWSDLRALASVLHAAVTGQAALGSAVPRVHRPLTGLPYDPRFLAGIDRALSVDPRQRLRSVAEFRRCLGWAPPAAEASSTTAPAPARAAAPVLSAAAERALAPPVRPATRSPGGSRAEPGFGDSRFQSRFDPPPLPVAPPRRTGTWLVLLCAASLAGAALYLTLRPRAPKPVPVPAVALQPLAAPLRAAPAEPDKAADDEAPEAAPAAAAAPPPPEPAAVAPVEAPPAPRVEAAPAPTTAKPPAEAVVANATNPRAACGTRVNFALLYCMQSQCAKPQFAKHAQCDELRRAGEVQ